jgi:energy-converting hydrogenase Eha subunit C
MNYVINFEWIIKGAVGKIIPQHSYNSFIMYGLLNIGLCFNLASFLRSSTKKQKIFFIIKNRLL